MIQITLPALAYDIEEFFALEREAIFLKTWQLVGHVKQFYSIGVTSSGVEILRS